MRLGPWKHDWEQKPPAWRCLSGAPTQLVAGHACTSPSREATARDRSDAMNPEQRLTSSEQSCTGCAVLLGRRVRLIVAGLLLTAGMLTLAAGSVAAARVTAPQLISGTDLLPKICDEGANAENELRDWEKEPSLAVNPTNPQNLVSAWIQDFGDGIE